ncbi:hypothetical protein ACS2L4_00035 (plasmid) [Thermofilum pendens]
MQEDVKSLQVKLSSAQTDLSALKAQVSTLRLSSPSRGPASRRLRLAPSL